MTGEDSGGARRKGGRPGRRRSDAGGRPPDGTGGEQDAPGDAESVARLICLRLLEFAPRTRAQLALVLARRGVPAEAAAAVLDRFGEVGLIDDAAFSRAWVASRHAGRGLAGRALGHELRQRGVEPDVIAGAVAELDPEAERATAVRLVRRKLPRLAGVPADRAAQRLAGMLARKGYPAGMAYSVVREELSLRDEDLALGDPQCPEGDAEPAHG